ncbi:vWA domain-containing protein [Cyclobacterium salsum]|uniref:vWA domain-containing protein n=1 Tax=Cyclobacterium salsum TaxID=2666329 RepID=UPI0013910235|nr:VWA domain-containing protein [Cyclobacterium salsum]
MRFLTIFFLVVLSSYSGSAQEYESLSPIVFIYDASGSMWGQLEGRTKMEIAAEVLTNSVNGLRKNQKIGLVAYGHRNKGDCGDVEFLVDFENGTKTGFNTALHSIKPLGMTPLAYATSLVIDQLRDSKAKATVILVTDGIESCDGNICEVVRQAKKEGIDFRLHIIGFGLVDEDTEPLKCAALAGEGRYFPATDAVDLGAVLNEATTATIDKPKSNASVYAVKNGMPIDAMVKAYDVVGKREPISVRTYRDTVFFYLPPSTYNFEASPLEGSDVKMVTVSGIESTEDRLVHQEISFDSGKFGISILNNGDFWDAMVKVIDQNGNRTASIRTYNSAKEVEVNPGTYKITIQALAMNGMDTYAEIENVTIQSGGITPVTFDFQTGTAHIDARVADRSIDSMVTLTEESSGKNVAGGRTYDRGKEFLLNPGMYKVKVTPLGDYKDRNAQTFTLEVKKADKIMKTVHF